MGIPGRRRGGVEKKERLVKSAEKKVVSRVRQVITFEWKITEANIFASRKQINRVSFNFMVILEITV